jgi:hypothetical protein
VYIWLLQNFNLDAAPLPTFKIQNNTRNVKRSGGIVTFRFKCFHRSFTFGRLTLYPGGHTLGTALDNERNRTDTMKTEPSAVPEILFTLFLSFFVTVFFASKGATGFAVCSALTPVLILSMYLFHRFRKSISMFFRYLSDGKSFHVYNGKGEHIAKYSAFEFESEREALEHHNENRPNWADRGESAHLL